MLLYFGYEQDGEDDGCCCYDASGQDTRIDMNIVISKSIKNCNHHDKHTDGAIYNGRNFFGVIQSLNLDLPGSDCKVHRSKEEEELVDISYPKPYL